MTPLLNSWFNNSAVKDISVEAITIMETIHHVQEDSINTELVWKTALKYGRGSGPSRMDSNVWGHMLLSNNFREPPAGLYGAIAYVIKKICTEKVFTWSVEPFFYFGLVLMDKNFGLKPIGVG